MIFVLENAYFPQWERVASEDPMFSDLKTKVETYSADEKLAMRQRVIDEAGP